MSMVIAWGAVLGLVVLYFVLSRVMGGGSKSRRARELASGPKQFHWGMIGGYMGNADPTKLEAAAAAKILQNGWSCKDVEALRRKLSLYRTGELNDAFDAVRIAWLSELAGSAGWFAHEEFEGWCSAATERVRSGYRSWTEYETALLDGWRRWWPEVAGKPMPASDEERMTRVRGESKALFASIPWAA